MSTNNKALWDSVKMTDPRQVKEITGKSYKGDSPKPYWLIERATEVFGPVGFGWGTIVKSERFERLGEHDVLHVAVVSVWYMLDGKRSETFDQMGGTKAAYKSSKGVLVVDEDAGKKSVTDAMVKCLSMIGFAGDIFSGQWGDSKYVAFAREHYEQAEREPQQQAMPSDVLADWLNYIGEAATCDDVKSRLAEGKTTAQECGDTGAYEQMKAAAKARAATLKAATSTEAA